MLLRALLVKDLRRSLGDRNALIVGLLLPLGLTAVFGFSFGGFGGGGGGIGTIPLAVVGEPPAILRGPLDEALTETGLFEVVWTDKQRAETMVAAGDVKAALLLPEDLLDQWFAGRRVELTLWRDVNSPIKAGIIEQILQRLLLRVRAGEAAYYGAWSGDWYPEDQQDDPFADLFADASAVDVYRRIRDGSSESRAAWDLLQTLVDHQIALQDAWGDAAVELRIEERGAGQAETRVEGPADNVFNHFLPGMAILFLMFSAASAGTDLHRERRAGTLRRIFTTPVGAIDLLASKWLQSAVAGALQLVVLLAAGRLLFKVNLGPDVWTLPLLLVFVAAAVSALFIPIALATRSEKQMAQITTGLVLLLALLGGNFIPLEFAPGFLRLLGRFTPNYWANRGLTDVIAYDQSLPAVAANIGVLGGCCVVCLGLSLLLLARRGGREGLI